MDALIGMFELKGLLGDTIHTERLDNPLPSAGITRRASSIRMARAACGSSRVRFSLCGNLCRLPRGHQTLALHRVQSRCGMHVGVDLAGVKIALGLLDHRVWSIGGVTPVLVAFV